VAGYLIEQVIWEFSIFRKLLREMLEQIASQLPLDELFKARELILEVADLSEIHSIRQYVEETSLERDSAREALKQANEQKDRFLAVLSHELRNPLAAITAAIQIARSPEKSESQHVRALDIVERQARYQTRLVEDLLDVNRISQGRIELKKKHFDLRKAVANAIEAYMPAIEGKSIQFQLVQPDQELPLFADQVRIEQVISNLLANSLKFTRSGDSISISLGREDSFATARVRDTGFGIEPTGIKEIFNLFGQLRHPGNVGLGIGLWLSKVLVEMHGGTIEAGSEGAGKGAELTVRLPLAEKEVAPQAALCRRVLLVEDDPDQREAMSMLLSEPDLEIVTAKDGSEAIRLASDSRFDVCILDLNLPDISGYELVQRLVEKHPERRPVTVALTGLGRSEDGERVKSAGFDHYVVKPADTARLQSIIRGRN